MTLRSRPIVIALAALALAVLAITMSSDTSTIQATTPPRGEGGDLLADAIIGQPDFSEIVPGPTTDDKLALPHGVVVDLSTAANRFYVYDAGHNRILGFDGTCIDTPPCSASIVLGQPDMTTSACNGDSNFQNYPTRSLATSSTLCGEFEWGISVSEGGSGASMYVDGSGNLYVPDYINHRILKYNSPFTTDTIADDVWGQVDFNKNDCNKTQATYWSPIPAPDATSLCFNWGSSNNWTAGVDVDASGNLWVADSGNNRVLMYAPGSKTATRVFGQQNFTTRTAGNGLNQMRDPAVVRVSSQGWVYVAQHKTTDPDNGRMMIFKPPFSDGMNASVVKDFNRPSSIDFDPTRAGLWIMNELNRTLELWDEDLAGASPIETIGFSGQGNFLDDASGSLGIDSDGNLMMAIGRGSYTDDVVLIPKEGGGYGTAVRLFEAFLPHRTDRDLTAAVNGVQWAKNPDVDPLLGSQLAVGGGGRILFWNNPDASTMSNYSSADGYLDWLTCNSVQVCNPVISGFDDADGACCAGMSVSDNHLWVSMFHVRDDPHRILVYELPLTSGELPVDEIKLPLAVLPETVGGPEGTIAAGDILWGLVAQPDDSNLWISQRGQNRVFRLRDPLGASPIVDVILGQTSTTGTSCNQGGSPTTSTLCLPGSLALDRYENLFLSDHSLEIQGNRRLLEFNDNLFPTGSQTITYALAASRTFPNIATWQPAFDSENRMVVGYNPYACSNPSCPDTGQNRYFPGLYEDPLSGPTDADEYFDDFHSMPFSATFDDNDDLYIADLNRGRVLVYISPTMDHEGAFAVAAGGMSTLGNEACALILEGGVKCWGGFSSEAPHDICADTATPCTNLTNVAAMAAGGVHNCVLLDEVTDPLDTDKRGKVKCWGKNDHGQLGDGTNTDRSVPVYVNLTWPADVGTIAITTGAWHTCAVSQLNKVKCWGLNSSGQLGDGTTVSRNSPVDVSGGHDTVLSIVAGRSHTCFQTEEDTGMCWGSNSDGQLGDDTTTDRLVPVDVCAPGATAPCNPASMNVLDEAAGLVAGMSHTCALTTSGGVLCWGRDAAGALGNGSDFSSSVPGDVCAVGSSAPCSANKLSGVSAIGAGWEHACAVQSGGVVCWGWNATGALGDDQGCGTVACQTPVDVCAVGTSAPCSSNSLSGISSVEAGGFQGHGYTCAVTTRNSIKCWGDNDDEQLGSPTTQQCGSQDCSTTPIDVDLGTISGIKPPPPPPSPCGGGGAGSADYLFMLAPIVGLVFMSGRWRRRRQP